MIVEVIVTVLLAAVGALVSVLPEAEPLGLSTASGWLQGYATLNGFLPLTEAVGCLALILGVEFGVFAFRVFRTVYGMIPGKFT